FNKRTDEYGGSLENRTRFAKEVLHAVRKKCGTNFIIIMRLNCRDYIEGGLEIDDMATIACEIEKEEIVDIFNITAGVFDSPFYPVVPYMSIPRGVYSEFSKIIKEKLVKTPVSVVGRINTPEIAEKILLENRSDMVTVGRALIADPFFPQKISENNLKDIRYCIGCNACLNQIMIEEPVACAVNVNFLGTDEDIQKTTEKKKILIIGAGPAGLETARVCAIRGHDVQLIDKASKIGGSLNAASSSPLKNEIKHLINYYDNELSKLNVKINLETTFSESTLESFKPDIAVITVGSECLLPEIKGLVEKGYYSYKDVLKGKIPDGKRIAILGGGMIGLDVADYLADKDKEITILEESKALGSDLYALVGVEVAPTTLKHTNINAELDFTIAEIKNNEIIGKREDQEIAIGFDDIVIALAKKTDFIYEEDLIEKISKVFKIGDCKKPRKIKEAIEEGYNLGLNIDTAKGIELMDMQSDNENDIKQIIIRKIKDSSFNISDIPLYLEVMVEICNTNEKIQKKSSKIKLQFQFSIENGSNYWIKITNGHFTTGEGKLAEADVSIIMQKSIAAGIFTGEVNATSAYMRKQIKFLGSMRHGLKFQQWTNAVTEELGLG
ncbi:MAG: FAD-binding protein, partial [Asgard group archaeon]|nr:FAD-binding protein [Asgard group archaeon]